MISRINENNSTAALSRSFKGQDAVRRIKSDADDAKGLSRTQTIRNFDMKERRQGVQNPFDAATVIKTAVGGLFLKGRLQVITI